ncbi:MAG TPA: class I adenylate-forming enzyme family protein [Actinomycetota bacterium]|nr:class I adenylate-forming enzyme family protein [Actinomycetota bacterium]
MTAPEQAVTLSRISDYPRHHAQRSPDRAALLHESGSLSYAELAERIDQQAAALLAAGIRSGDRVATMATPRIDAIVTYLATASIGAIWLGLNPGYTTREFGYVLGDSRPALTTYALPAGADDALRQLTEALAAVGLAPPIAADDPGLRAGAAEVTPQQLQAAREAVDTQDPALIVYTSGSTGQPKGALIRHSGLVRLGVVESSVWHIQDLVVLCNLPVNHIGCIGDLVGVPLVAGGTLLLRDGFDAEQVLADLQDFGISALFQVPTMLQRIASLPGFDTADLSRLEVVGWGGSPLPVATMRRYRERGCALVSTYGLTEATCSVTYTDADSTEEVLLNTVGRPDPGMNVRLLGEDGDWVADGERGEVCVRNETSMVGYWNRPEATAAAYTPDGWLRTGDIGYVRPDGNLVLVGRAHEMFKSGGYNVYPREVEQVIESHPGVALAAVVPVPHAEYHEVGMAFVQPRPDAELDLDDLRRYCRERLAGYKVPKAFEVMAHLPLLPVGKVDKTQLREQATDERGSQS